MPGTAPGLPSRSLVPRSRYRITIARRMLSQHQRQLCPAPNALSVRFFRILVVDVPIGPALEQLLERHSGLHAGQCCTEAEVQSLPEAQMACRPVDVEAIGVPEVTFVAVRGAVDQQ